MRLPRVHGAIAAFRRRWIRGIGWYPGDWLPASLAAAVIAAGGAAAAIVLGRSHSPSATTTFVAPVPRGLGAGPTAPTGANGRLEWPPSLDGWTVVLLSAPATHGTRHPLAVAKGAAREGLTAVGVLDSSVFGSLHPGYYMVFSGVYGTPGDAQTALETVRARGFGGAYVLRVAP